MNYVASLNLALCHRRRFRHRVRACGAGGYHHGKPTGEQRASLHEWGHRRDATWHHDGPRA